MNYDNFMRLTVTIFVIFIIIKILLETKLVEAILLALIISTVIFVIENTINLYYINPNSKACQICISDTNANKNMEIVLSTPTPIVPITESVNSNKITEEKIKEKFENMMPQITQEQSPQSESTTNTINNISSKLSNFANNVVSDISNLTNANSEQQPIKSIIKNNNNNNNNNQNGLAKLMDPTFKDGYVKYQQDGEQKMEDEQVLKNNLFRMKIGDPELVNEYIKDGNKFYYDIYSRSINAPTPKEAIKSDLEYGDYNYLKPINKGMASSAYTFISPNNWAPIPLFPNQCVTNKRCTTCPVLMNDGNQYMTFTSIDDFNRASRFTGNMNINVDYIKNVLNNGEGY